MRLVTEATRVQGDGLYHPSAPFNGDEPDTDDGPHQPEALDVVSDPDAANGLHRPNALDAQRLS